MLLAVCCLDVELTVQYRWCFAGNCTRKHFEIVVGLVYVLQAAQCGNVKIITMLEKAGGQINVTNTSGMTPLAYSAGQGNVKALHILLNKGANVNFCNQDGTTPLHQAASSGNQVQLTPSVRLLPITHGQLSQTLFQSRNYIVMHRGQNDCL